MTMRPGVRKLALTAHVTFSVGWLGAVAAYLALAGIGLTSDDARVVRAVYVVLKLIGWFVIVPCSLAALLTGVVESLGTEWGLVRHYWVLLKLVLTVAATVVLVVHMQTVNRVSDLATTTTVANPDFGSLQAQLVVHAAGGLLVLLIATALSIYKPLGRTAFGRVSTVGTPPGWYVTFGIVALVILAVIVHVATGGLHGH
jgi:hypothetical protein